METKSRKPRRGRPKKGQELGERVQLSLRVTPEMKRRLDGAAAASGRSQSQEAEFRLERSFDRADLLTDVLEATYGNEAAGLILSIAEAMTAAGRWAAWISEGGMEAATGRSWPRKPYPYQEAENAAAAILAKRRPKGEMKAPRPGALQTYGVGLNQTLGEFIADGMQRMLDGSMTPAAEFQEPIARIKRLLDREGHTS